MAGETMSFDQLTIWRSEILFWLPVARLVGDVVDYEECCLE